MGGPWPEFRATEPFFLFDYFRVPYQVLTRGTGAEQACGALHVRRGGEGEATIRWPIDDALGQRMPAPALLHLGGAPFWGRAIADRLAHELLADSPGHWRPTEHVRDAAGRRVGSVWADPDGNLMLPFDPGKVIGAFWREDYLDGAGRPSRESWPLRLYYGARPGMPRGLQIALRRAYSRLQARKSFPRWPAETALHDLYRWLFDLIARTAGGRIPHLAPWPDGRSWALVLTHDVETASGYARLPEVRDLERSLGYRSSWNLVTNDYVVEDQLVSELAADGFEVGVHGYSHDGRDYASIDSFRTRLPEIRRHAERWGARGYRSPSTLRVWDWMPELGFDYDSSYTDTAPFEPQRGGCCSLFPFFNEDLVELPITMPQDHTVFEILNERDEGLWRHKAELIRGLGGMALMLTHPDYATVDRLAAYRRLLEEHRDDATAWRALPREVSAWWRARAASRLEPDRGDWRVVGPAAGRAEVAFA